MKRNHFREVGAKITKNIKNSPFINKDRPNVRVYYYFFQKFSYLFQLIKLEIARNWIFLISLYFGKFNVVNDIIMSYFKPPYHMLSCERWSIIMIRDFNSIQQQENIFVTKLHFKTNTGMDNFESFQWDWNSLERVEWSLKMLSHQM